MIPWDEKEAISSIQIAAADYRDRNRLAQDAVVEVALPHWRHEQYLKHHGSQAALDEFYHPCKLVCPSCLSAAEGAVERLRAKGWVQ